MPKLTYAFDPRPRDLQPGRVYDATIASIEMTPKGNVRVRLRVGDL